MCAEQFKNFTFIHRCNSKTKQFMTGWSNQLEFVTIHLSFNDVAIKQSNIHTAVANRITITALPWSSIENVQSRISKTFKHRFQEVNTPLLRIPRVLTWKQSRSRYLWKSKWKFLQRKFKCNISTSCKSTVSEQQRAKCDHKTSYTKETWVHQQKRMTWIGMQGDHDKINTSWTIFTEANSIWGFNKQTIMHNRVSIYCEWQYRLEHNL